MRIESARRRTAPAGLVFGASIGASAFLLFMSEPMVGRIVLPVFGGAPAVWATVLVFFQVLLLLGYLYAHILVTRLRPPVAAALHVAVLALAAILTFAAPADVAGLTDPRLPVIPALLALLLVIIGPAAFSMTATTPLVSAWYARVRRAENPDADPRDPYWLYALSNGGSLVSLLAYPLLIEPNIGLSAQRAAWSIGFACLALLIAASALRLRAAGPVARDSDHPAGPDVLPPVEPVLGSVEPEPTIREAKGDDRVTVGDRLRWLALAAVPAGMLSAVTNLVTTDLIAAPLLWVIPLAVYLGSFVVAFSARARLLVPIAISLAPATLTLLWVPLGSVAGWPLLALLVIEYAGLGIVAVAIHGRLATLRPIDRHLTDFYLVMSAGGALGGAFVGVAAPLLFNGVWEYPILVAAALGVLALTAPPAPRRRPLATLVGGAPTRLLPYLLVAVPLVGGMVASQAPGADLALRSAMLGGMLLAVGGSPRFLATATSIVLLIAVFLVPSPVLFRDRSFFGVTELLRDGVKTVLMHGTTRHGSQWLAPDRRDIPLDYYAPSGPVGDLFTVWDDRPPGTIRVVGLGAGALAAYGRPGDTMVFYEIDSLVQDVAANSQWFTFLADSAASTSVRIGDGRLLLQGDPTSSVDMVVMDAFSSDTVPVHLLTVEAFTDIARALRSDGVVAVHVSNRFYDLAKPVSAALATLDFTVLVRTYAPDELAQLAGATGTGFVVGTRDPATIGRLEAAGWVRPATDEVPLTDDFPDLLRYLLATR